MKITITLDVTGFQPFDQTVVGNHLEELEYRNTLSFSAGTFVVEVQMNDKSDPLAVEVARQECYLTGLVVGILKGRGRLVTKHLSFVER